jgi:methylisocitrate lyase
LNVDEFEDLGYRLVLFPVTALRMATKAIERVLAELRTHGSQRGLVDQMHTRQQLYDLLRYEEYEQRDRQFHSRGDDHANE